MKRLFNGVCVLAIFGACIGSAFAQRNPRGNSKIALNGKPVSVEYGRPSLNGRSVQDMLSKLSAGEVWRLGADKSTTFSTFSNLAFGDVSISKGEYSLWARKEADNTWKLVFNSQHGQWGTEHDASKDVAAVSLKETKAGAQAEQVTLNLTKSGDGGELSIQWGDMQLTTNFKAK